MSEIELNEYGVNKAIKYHILEDEAMRKIGFTDHDTKTWYFCRSLKNKEISFNVTIPKDGVSSLDILVLDEDFGQPYDYQYILGKNPNFEFALCVKDEVEEWMSYLQDAGVLSGHEYGEYI